MPELPPRGQSQLRFAELALRRSRPLRSLWPPLCRDQRYPDDGRVVAEDSTGD